MSLSIIHFSDIHIKNSEDVILQKVNELKSACVSSLPSNGDVVIVISGDIAFSGERHQYKLAKNLIDTISGYISEQKESRIHLVCVPGNHDCDFTKESSVRNVLIESVQPNTIDKDYYDIVSGVQGEYNHFAKLFGISTEHILPRVEVACGDNSVLFVLANTAWMSVLHEKPGKIIMPCDLFEGISPEDYKVVFYVCHHPINWLEPDYKRCFLDHIRQNSDMLLVGHEHAHDRYEKIGDSFSVFCNHGKELQDSNSNDSAFSVINFDNAFLNYNIIDFVWDGYKYYRRDVSTKQYCRNIVTRKQVYCPNEKIICYADDIGVIVNHFAKENVLLADLFVWPDFCKFNYCNEKNGGIIVRTNSIEELYRNKLTILVGQSCSGKTTIAKRLFIHEESKDSCCLLVDGTSFTSSDEARINETIEKAYIEQYSKDFIEEFRQLPKNQRSIIVDDFDLIKNIKSRRTVVLDYLCGFFDRVTILLSSGIELSTILTSNSIDALGHVTYYEIMPLGNRKRKEMISKWYHLNETALTEEEISDRVDRAIEKINIFLGNGKGIVPGAPVFVLSALQNLDAVQKSFTGSKYGFLYESLILSSLSKVSSDYINPGSYDIDVGILSELAFNMLQEKRIHFTEEQIEAVASNIRNQHLLEIPTNDIIQRMVRAKIIYLDVSNGNSYRFMYPYIFYYFCGRYIAYHIEEKAVKDKIEHMSSRLFNETYGNIVIFVCHFANNSDVIDTVLLNAYDTLRDYEPFDFTKTNNIIEEIKNAVDVFIPKSIATSDADVNDNKENRLAHMDEVGLNDGQIYRDEDTIDDEISEQEKDIADVVAALKTIEVLGEILQNYPMGINGQKKIEIIDEILKLGMRSVQAVIKTMGYLKKDLVEYIYERLSREKKNVSKEKVINLTRQLINLLVTGMARGMIHQVAIALNSEHLLLAAKKVFEEDDSISSKLVLLDLTLNCLNKCDYSEIEALKKEYRKQNEVFASKIVDSIVGHYLNYHRCDYNLRAKLCSLCGLSQQQTLISSQQNCLN